MIQAQDIEENALTYYQGITRLLGGQFTEQHQVAWFATGCTSLPRFNGVLRTLVSRTEELSQAVAPVLAVFLSRNLPFFWVDWPISGAPGLGRYLNSTGIPFVHFSMPAMSRALDGLPQAALPNGVEIVRVQARRDQVDWLNVLMEGFEEPEPARADFQRYLTGSLTEAQPIFEHFLARRQGEPCAISTLLRAGRGAGIYHVTTLPAYRGRGFGKALTLAAMQSAQSAGYSTAILFATPSGYPLYQRLGFETVSTADLYIRDGTR